MTRAEVATKLKISRQTVINRSKIIWGEYPLIFTDEQVSDLIEEIHENPIRLGSGKICDATHKCFNEAMVIIKRDGMIPYAELKQIFNDRTVETILNTFDKFDEPLYQETPPGMKRGGVFRLNMPVLREMRKEALLNNGYQNNYNSGRIRVIA